MGKYKNNAWIYKGVRGEANIMEIRYINIYTYMIYILVVLCNESFSYKAENYYHNTIMAIKAQSYSCKTQFKFNYL
jgi:hypothetical protein